MRIIKAAKRTEEYITTCNNCGSILGLANDDLSKEATGYGYYCEVCKCKNHIKANDRSELFPWKIGDEIHETKILQDSENYNARVAKW